MGNEGKRVFVHYEGTLNDGTVFDSSYERGEVLEFVCGAGMMIPGFDEAVKTMEIGEIRSVHLTPDQAYGEYDEQNTLTVPVAQMPGSEELTVGDRVMLSGPGGQPVPVVVSAREGDTITFDGNHELAGKELNFKIELKSVAE